jgi:hypothetical protein
MYAMGRGRKPIGDKAMTTAERQARFRAAQARSATFDVTTSLDFYAMLVADFDEYMTEPESTRRALHCAITAYHLREWVWGDWLKTDYEVWKALDIRSDKEFYKWIHKGRPWFFTIEALATGMKHFRHDQGFKTERVGAPPFMLDELEAGLNQGAWDGPLSNVPEGHLGFDEEDEDFSDEVMPYVAESHGKGCLFIDFGEGTGPHRWGTAAALLEVVVRFWRDFFKTHHPSPDLPVSKHHLTL